MISGFFAPAWLPQPLLISAVVVAEFGPEAKLVPFVVDTGATDSIIHAGDALNIFGETRFELDSSKWINARIVSGVGGSMRVKVSEASFGFRHDDGTIDTILSRVLIGDMRSAGLPSLLGRDLLRLFHLEIHGDDSVMLQRLLNP